MYHYIELCAFLDWNWVWCRRNI